MALYRGRYRIESARLPGWDYAGPGWYFITVCTRDRACFLGDVRDDRVVLSAAGRIVAEEWQRTGVLRRDVEMDAWVVMPNHVHGIIRILHPSSAAPPANVTDPPDVGTRTANVHPPPANPHPHVETPRRGVSTAGRRDVGGANAGRRDVVGANAGRRDRPSSNPSRLRSGSIGAIVGQFKSVCTKRIRAGGHIDFAWQARFYDRIIRYERSLDRVRRYIAENPRKWARDHNNPARAFPRRAI